MIIAVEGVDGTGKSDVSKLLSERMNAVLYPTPPAAYMKKRSEIDEFASDWKHYWFYLRGIQDASREIESIAAVSSVVLDRYWVTTVVYHRAMGIPADLKDFGSIIQPDHTVYLTVASEIQLQRLNKRGLTPGDVRMAKRQELLRRFYEEALDGMKNVIRIDTSTIDQTTVVDWIIKSLALSF